jgi:hypothetical protein
MEMNMGENEGNLDLRKLMKNGMVLNKIQLHCI